MNREELYREMEQRRIIMDDVFAARLERTPWKELEARWTGALELEKEHRPKRKADWLALIMWNSTALTVGLDELERRAAEQRKMRARLEKERRQKAEQKLHACLSRKKLTFWKRLSVNDRRILIETFMPTQDEFYQKCVRESFLDNLAEMADRIVLLWFWHALPPFSDAETGLPKNSNIAA